MTPGILLANLGSPRSPSTGDLRRYLREFLGDPRVIDRPRNPLLRWLLVNGIIVPFRAPKSARAYRSIWTEQGSPLVSISREVAEKLPKTFSGTRVPVYLGMRYGEPSIAAALEEAARDGVDRLLLIPQYPHYAASSWETVVERTRALLRQHHPQIDLSILPPFFDDPDYIEALYQSALPYLQEPYDHLLFSYHGLPVRHIIEADRTGAHVRVPEDGSPCCTPDMPAFRTCYRAQVLTTTRAFIARAGIPEETCSVSFQSRLIGEPWLSPYTDARLRQLAASGCQKLLVITPAFVADCLETLEEIATAGKKLFLEAGGKHFTHIPCLNAHEEYIRFLHKKSSRWLESLS